MLFNSYGFILLFLPIVVIGHIFIVRYGSATAAIVWLVGASLFFYGWWAPPYLALLLGSVLVNYLISRKLVDSHKEKAESVIATRWLIFGICVNLGLLGYFKYANFFVDNLNLAAGTEWKVEPILLPLAISFFTFQQIAYLVDAKKGVAGKHSFLRYTLFVAFFPQLIAGPIVLHSEVMPQYMRSKRFRVSTRSLGIGLTIFAIGLAKKVLIADNLAGYVGPIFDAAEAHETLSFFESWSAVLCYTFQIYFDFSGYSDMAIGLARIFNIRLPLNFHSPYKALSIGDFWRRWHMTLSRFLRDYVYYPLGGNRQGQRRQFTNLMVVMLLGGLWHGAGWAFVVWGGLHGFYLVIDHGWKKIRSAFGIRNLPKPISWLVTFTAVAVGWVFFRAETLSGGLEVLSGMAGINGFHLGANHRIYLGPMAGFVEQLGIVFIDQTKFSLWTVLWIGICLPLVLTMPNTQEWIGYRGHRQSGPGPILSYFAGGFFPVWRPAWYWGVFMGLIAAFTVGNLSNPSEFLYFNF
jgi:D-alanyl-lipoteichoic acid acyltransferase DltB (MBOAT superfamily)